MARLAQQILWTGKFMLVVGLMAGCHENPPLHQNQDALVMPAPLGTYVHRAEDIQASKAKASAFVFFLDEWYMGGTFLGPHGARHLQAILQELPHTPMQVQIQPAPDLELNETRRLAMVNVLLKEGILDADNRVVIAFPQAEGLRGDEAERIYRDMLQPQRNLSGVGGIQNGNISGGYGGGSFGGGFGGGYGGGGYGGGIGGGYGGGFGGGYGGYGGMQP